MSSSKNTPLLLLAMSLTGAAFLLVLLLRDSTPPKGTPEQALTQAPAALLGPQSTEAPAEAPAKTPASANSSAPDSAESDLQAELQTELELRVVDGTGREMTGFSLVLDGPAGEQQERSTAGLIRGLTAGTWKVRGAAPDLLPGFGEVHLELGQRRRLVIQLLGTLRVDGHLFDNQGQALTRTEVWLLGPGESHPSTPGIAKARLGTLTGAGGSFHLRPAKPGQYRISVGPPGAPRWAELRGQALEPGGASKVHVVIPSKGRLKLRMAPAPAGQPVDLLNIKVEVLSMTLAEGTNAAGRSRGTRGGDRQARQQARRESKGTPPREDTGKGQKRRNRGQPANPDLSKGAAPADQPAPKTPRESFVRWQVVVLTDGEERSVDLAPPERELRLVLSRRGGRFECSPGFFLLPGITTRVTLPWPAAGATEGLLGIQIERIPTPEGKSEVGCTWSE